MQLQKALALSAFLHATARAIVVKALFAQPQLRERALPLRIERLPIERVDATWPFRADFGNLLRLPEDDALGFESPGGRIYALNAAAERRCETTPHVWTSALNGLREGHDAQSLFDFLCAFTRRCT